MRATLEKQREAEREFVQRARESEKAPQGWPAALVMFHIGMWRERMRNALSEIADGGEQTTVPPIPDEVDHVNDAELARGIGTPLADAAARSDHLLSEIADLYERLGERPMEWNQAQTTTSGVLRNSYTHPRLHMYEYYVQNGAAEHGRRLFEQAVDDMRTALAPDLVMGTVLYNLATVRAQEGRSDDALDLLREAIERRPDAKANAAEDSDFGELRHDPRFRELVST